MAWGQLWLQGDGDGQVALTRRHTGFRCGRVDAHIIINRGRLGVANRLRWIGLGVAGFHGVDGRQLSLLNGARLRLIAVDYSPLGITGFEIGRASTRLNSSHVAISSGVFCME